MTSILRHRLGMGLLAVACGHGSPDAAHGESGTSRGDVPASGAGTEVAPGSSSGVEGSSGESDSSEAPLPCAVMRWSWSGAATIWDVAVTTASEVAVYGSEGLFGLGADGQPTFGPLAVAIDEDHGDLAAGDTIVSLIGSTLQEWSTTGLLLSTTELELGGRPIEGARVVLQPNGHPIVVGRARVLVPPTSSSFGDDVPPAEPELLLRWVIVARTSDGTIRLDWRDLGGRIWDVAVTASSNTLVLSHHSPIDGYTVGVLEALSPAGDRLWGKTTSLSRGLFGFSDSSTSTAVVDDGRDGAIVVGGWISDETDPRADFEQLWHFDANGEPVWESKTRVPGEIGQFTVGQFAVRLGERIIVISETTERTLTLYDLDGQRLCHAPFEDQDLRVAEIAAIEGGFVVAGSRTDARGGTDAWVTRFSLTE